MEHRASALSGLLGDSLLTMGAIGLQTTLVIALQLLMAHKLAPQGIGVLSLLLLVVLIAFWFQGIRREPWFDLS